MRFRQTERWIPKEYEKLAEDPDIQAVVYGGASDGIGQAYAMGYYRKSVHPKFHYTFKSIERRDKYIAEWMENLKQSAAVLKNMMAERKANREQPNKLKVGDILVFSWGWEQTNVDFFQVLETRAHSVKIRPIASKTVPDMSTGNSMACYVVAVKDHFLDKPAVWKRVQYGDSVKMASYGHCGLWDGKPHYESWYA
jgi:hypothetical protein